MNWKFHVLKLLHCIWALTIKTHIIITSFSWQECKRKNCTNINIILNCHDVLSHVQYKKDGITRSNEIRFHQFLLWTTWFSKLNLGGVRDSVRFGSVGFGFRNRRLNPTEVERFGSVRFRVSCFSRLFRLYSNSAHPYLRWSYSGNCSTNMCRTDEEPSLLSH